MITVIYGTKNGTQNSIAWWLCNAEGVGPQIYNATFQEHTWHGSANKNSGLINDAYRHPEHTECHRLMENIRGDIIAPMRKLESDFKMLVWSNYFGCLEYPDQKIDCDKLIICEQSNYEDAFHYCMSHAFKTLDHNEIDSDSELWWTDHKQVNGEITDNWKELWYGKYHQAMHDAFDNNELKYMWQLNFMHWDLAHCLEHNKPIDIELTEHDNIKRLLVDKICNPNDNTSTDILLWHNKDALIVKDPTWFEVRPNMILEYLELENCVKLKTALNDYIDAYRVRKDWFDELVAKTFQ